GVEVGAHGEPGRRTVFGLVAAGDLQLGLDRPKCSLSAVVGEGTSSTTTTRPNEPAAPAPTPCLTRKNQPIKRRPFRFSNGFSVSTLRAYHKPAGDFSDIAT
ncbi:MULTISPECIES: hypothetical protein, partial [unclassified Streptomyces]|uniref:hypothetical protein n=1 Tax=unclassified Streptomyces TaxID=2593676 RepID=UPI0022715F34